MRAVPLAPADEARRRILRDLATGARQFDIHQLVRELTAGKCSTPADGAPQPGTLCPCCCQLVHPKQRVAILHGVVLHEGCL